MVILKLRRRRRRGPTRITNFIDLHLVFQNCNRGTGKYGIVDLRSGVVEPRRTVILPSVYHPLSRPHDRVHHASVINPLSLVTFRGIRLVPRCAAHFHPRPKEAQLLPCHSSKLHIVRD